MPRPYRPLLLFALAAAGFLLLFRGLVFHYWAQMTLTVLALCVLAFVCAPERMWRALRVPVSGAVKAVLWGAISAAALYGVFFAGNIAVKYVLADGPGQVQAVYSLKQGTPGWVIGLLIALIIGPGEEIFWRGYLQGELEERWGTRGVVPAVIAYGAVHVASGNLILLGASLVCGAFWAAMYYKYRSLWMNIVSHVVWDLAVFLLFPFT